MPFDSLSDDPLIQRLLAASLFLGPVLLAAVMRLAMSIAARRLERGAAHALAPGVLRTLRNPGWLLLVLLGAYLGLLALPEASGWRDPVNTAWNVAVVVLVAHTLANATRVVIAWYIVVVAPRTPTRFDERIMPFVRRVLIVAIYGVGTLLVLDAFGQPISPILGGLGITGLAVALALQPTLGNFFAGTYVLSDGAITVGDYIELQGGPAGYVVAVGWRTTKIRTWLNNLVIIPNSVLADNIVTNYTGPDPALNILVTCGVSYASDLDEVQRVCLAVTSDLIAESESAVKEVEPWFGYDSFGDSNIGFWIFFQAKDRIGSFILTNEIIKRLHTRFARDGIEINYPVRKLVQADAQLAGPPEGPGAS